MPTLNNAQQTTPQHTLLIDWFPGIQGWHAFRAHDRFEWGLSEDEHKTNPTLEHICTSNTRNKMSHDCLRGYGSWRDFNRLGTRILIFGNGDIIIIMLNLQKSDIRNKFKKSCVNAHPNCKTCVFCWKYICPKKGHIDMFSFTNNETVTWRGRGAGVKNKIQGARPRFGWILADDLQRLACWCDFSPWGQPLKIIRKYSAKTRSSPLDFIFDTCASASSSHCLNVCETEHICVYSFTWTNVSSVKKTRVLHLGRVLTQNSWICPIMSYLWMIGLVMRIFFPVGPTFEDHPQIFSQNKVQPLGFYFWHLRLGLFKSLLQYLWKWTYLCVLFFGTNIFSAKNTCFAIWVRVDTTFFEFVPDVWLLQIQHYNYYISISKD